MSDWFTKNLGDPLLADKSLDHIKELFLMECEKLTKTGEMAIFIRHESEGQLHCEVRVYFSPASHNIAKAVNAVICKTPSPEGLGLLAGSEDAWSILFPRSRA